MDYINSAIAEPHQGRSKGLTFKMLEGRIGMYDLDP